MTEHALSSVRLDKLGAKRHAGFWRGMSPASRRALDASPEGAERNRPAGSERPCEEGSEDMMPGFFGFWRAHQHCGGERECGPGRGFGRGHHGGGFPPGGGSGGGGSSDSDGDGGGFGVRRPLRFLAWKLELEEEQVAKLAIILDELKTERAQAAVDHRRSVAAYADAVSGEGFEPQKATEAGDQRVRSAERLREAVHKALAAIHALLDAEQRQRLAYLLRTGALSI